MPMGSEQPGVFEYTAEVRPGRGEEEEEERGAEGGAAQASRGGGAADIKVTIREDESSRGFELTK